MASGKTAFLCFKTAVRGRRCGVAAVDMLQVKRRWVLGTRVFNLPLSSWSLQEGGDPEGRSCGEMPTMRDVLRVVLVGRH